MAAVGIPAILFVDTMSGVLRFLPLTLTVSFIGLGIMLNNMPWLIAGGAAVALWALISVCGALIGVKIPEWLGGGMTPALFDTICSIVPGISYTKIPSVWFALMGYFMTYIICNANHVYTASPATASGYNPAGMGSNVLVANPVVASKNAIGVVQRKSVGLISLIAVSVLFVIIMIPRFMNQCESILGILSGLTLGSLWGWAMWASANTNNNNPLADIHGVMLGLSPGYLRHSPIACTPSG
jgi:hypothetical protein